MGIKLIKKLGRKEGIRNKRTRRTLSGNSAERERESRDAADHVFDPALKTG